MPFVAETKMINESKDGGNGRLIVSGIIQRANALNQNKRVYPKHILEREVKKFNSLITERQAIGELDHPNNDYITLANASHNINRLFWKGDDLHGDIEILPTPKGNILRKLFECGIRVGISSRGRGTVSKKSNGTLEVNEDFNLITWDFVSNPSTHGAFPTVITESVGNDTLANTIYIPINLIMDEILIHINSLEG